MANTSKNPAGQPAVTAKTKSALFGVCKRVKVWGGLRHVSPSEFEADKRKQKRVMRELVEAGYLSEVGDGFAVTDLAWDEVTPEPLDLTVLWEDGRRPYQWNQRQQHPFVRVDDLTPGQLREAVWKAGEFRFWVADRQVFDFGRPLQMGDVEGPTAPAEGVQEAMAKFRGKRLSSMDLLLLVDDECLASYVREAKAREEFDRLFVQNAAWGIHKVLGVPEEDAEYFRFSDGPDWMGRSDCNLGNDPDKWAEVLPERIRAATEKLARVEARLAAMRRVEREIESLGGWDVFRQRMSSELRSELAARAAADAALDKGSEP